METTRMTAAEIRRNYNEAKDKPKQITILADMNLCSRADIKRIIDGKTEELPPIAKKKCKGATPENTKQDIIRMHLNGSSGVEISKETGVSAPTVSKYIGEYKDVKIKLDAPTDTQKSENTPVGTTEDQNAPLIAPMTDLEPPMIVSAIMDCLLHDFAGYIVEIKATADTYTVRVKNDAEEIVHTKRRTPWKTNS